MRNAMRCCLEKSAETIDLFVGGLYSKIHIKVDTLGQLVTVMLILSTTAADTKLEGKTNNAKFSLRIVSKFFA